MVFIPDPTYYVRGTPRQYPRSYPSMAGVRARWLQELGTLDLGVRRQFKSTAGINVHLLVSGAAQAMFAKEVRDELQTYFRQLRNAFDPQSRDSLIPRHAMVDTYRQIGASAQRSVRAAYTQRRPQRDLPAYRTQARHARNVRFANGALLRAISAPDFFEATERGLRFINEDRLNREARHWRRLNFGTAGGAAVEPPRQFQLDWGRLVAGTHQHIGLTPDIRPAFRIPRGVFVAPGVFYPMTEVAGIARTGGTVSVVGSRHNRNQPGGQKVNRRQHLKETGRLTRGIASTNFLDRGVSAVARQLLPQFSEMFHTYYTQVPPPPNLRRQYIRPRVPVLPKGNVRRRYRSSGFAGLAGATHSF